MKTTPVWAEQAKVAGSATTKEGVTRYEAGDYLVSNKSDGTDEYAIGARQFESLYVLNDDQVPSR